MKTIWTSLQKHKSLLVFFSILFLFGIITGIIFYFKQDISLRRELEECLKDLFSSNVFSMRNIFYHLFIFLCICVSLFCFLGIPLFVFALFFEGLSIGFVIPIFILLFKVRAIGYFLVYFILVKFFYLCLLFFFFIKMISFTKTYLVCLKNKNYLFLDNLKYIVILGVMFLANDLFVFFVGNKILIFLLS